MNINDLPFLPIVYLTKLAECMAEENIQVCMPTTPAQIFHLLRRQMLRPLRRPLVIMSPKSLLRHPKVVSTKEEFANGSFQMLIDDATAKATEVKTLVFVTGKFYYDLLEEQELNGAKNIALVRVEQLYPLPQLQLDEIKTKYKNCENCGNFGNCENCENCENYENISELDESDQELEMEINQLDEILNSIKEMTRKVYN